MKVRDHCHITSKFRGAAHWDCNINFQLTKKVPVIFRNLKGYDFKYLVKEFGSENLELLKQGAYPYEYMNSFKRFNEEKLPARKYFYSSTKKGKINEDGKISYGHISIEDYLMCEKIWNKFKMKNMGKFIKTCLKYYELDPCHYFSSPGLSWDAMLKMTHVKLLEKISEIDKYLFIEKGSRGGISYIAKRYAKANNKYMSDYDSNKPSTFITYLDKHNLYGLSMSEYFPYKEFEWLGNVDEFDVNSINEKSEIGYFLEVDLEYPDKLHELHNDYPLAPEKLAISSNVLSKYCKEIADEYEIKVGDVKKLIPNLSNKIKYVLHYRNLQLYLSLGMKLTKIHRMLKFKQSDWMKKYIDFNTEKRKNATNDFEGDFFKLMINSVYGKTMENLRKRINIRFVNNEKDFLKYISKPSYVTHKLFDKDFAAIHEIKSVLMLNKTIYVGFTVLDLCKWMMYDFHYNYIKKNFNAELLFTDTDSLTYKVKSENDCEEFFKWKDLFDFSNYSKDSKCFNDANKKAIGKMKDEYGGVIIDQFIGLKSKMYLIKQIIGSESSTAKGVNIAAEFNEYKDALCNKKSIRNKMKRIQAKKHKIGTYEIDKISLSCFDDKRFVLDNGVHTLAYFHKDCKKNVIRTKIKIKIIMMIKNDNEK